MGVDEYLVALHKNGWSIKMHNTPIAGCAFAITVKKSGLGIGTFGLQGRGDSLTKAVLEVSKKVKKVLEDNKNEEE